MILREYFKDEELSCPCGCGAKSPEKAVEMLYAVRVIMGIPIIVNSSVRCQVYNKDAKGSVESMHLPPGVIFNRPEHIGAFDIVAGSKGVHHVYEYKIIRVCIAIGFLGIGIRDNTFLHIDNRDSYDIDYGKVWGYPK